MKEVRNTRIVCDTCHKPALDYHEFGQRCGQDGCTGHIVYKPKEQTGKEAKSAEENPKLTINLIKSLAIEYKPTQNDNGRQVRVHFTNGAIKAAEIANTQIIDCQQRIAELEAELKRKDEALLEITRTNWVNGKYFGRSSAQLHLAATEIAEQALKPKDR